VSDAYFMIREVLQAEYSRPGTELGAKTNLQKLNTMVTSFGKNVFKYAEVGYARTIANIPGRVSDDDIQHYVELVGEVSVKLCSDGILRRIVDSCVPSAKCWTLGIPIVRASGHESCSNKDRVRACLHDAIVMYLEHKKLPEGRKKYRRVFLCCSSGYLCCQRRIFFH
jgi:hypothetical protein